MILSPVPPLVAPVGDSGSIAGLIAELIHGYDDELQDVPYDARVAAMLTDIEAYGTSHGVRTHMQPWGPYGTVTGIELTDLYADEPGSGGGTLVMNRMTTLADGLSLAIYLRPEGSRSRTFYSRFGFDACAKLHGFMARYPKLDPEDAAEYGIEPAQQGLALAEAPGAVHEPRKLRP